MDPHIRATLDALGDRLSSARVQKTVRSGDRSSDWLVTAMKQRAAALSRSVNLTVDANKEEILAVVQLFLRWMEQGTIVRVIGAGRARLAAAIPANRLAHGGAHVFVLADIIPMPHSMNSGAVLAASASGQTPAVLEILSAVRRTAPGITVVGIAKADAREFRDLCHHFIGIVEDSHSPNPLRALADVGEYVISEVLDALVVAAGELGGFGDRRWQLGHENIGPGGPYDNDAEADLLFNRW